MQAYFGTVVAESACGVTKQARAVGCVVTAGTNSEAGAYCRQKIISEHAGCTDISGEAVEARRNARDVFALISVGGLSAGGNAET